VETGVPDCEKDFWVMGLNRPARLSSGAEPLYRAKPLNTRPVIVGVACEGEVFAWNLALDGLYWSTAKAADGWAALRHGRYGQPKEDPECLWFGPLAAGAEPRRLARRVSDYEVLAAGRCLFVASPQEGKQDRWKACPTAYVYDDQRKAAWSLLDGVEGMPPLDPELAGKPYVADKMTIQLLPGFGSDSRGRMVLVSFDHTRGDMRALPDRGILPSRRWDRWKKTILITADGRRGLLDLPEHQSEQVWLHNSGTVVRAVRAEEEGSGIRRLQLSRFPLRSPPVAPTTCLD
jgi:hypothetical protein